MKKLDMYLASRFFRIWAFSIIAFITIFIIVDIVEQLDRFIANQVPTSVVLMYYVYKIPYFIGIIIPIAALLASLFSIGSMARVNEIVAMKSAGMSLYRILMAPLILAFIISLANMAFNEFVSAPAFEKKNEIKVEYLEKNRGRRKSKTRNIYFVDKNNHTFLIKVFNAYTKAGDDVSIRTYDDKELLERIDAKKIIWQDSVWVLKDGSQRIFKGDSIKFAKFDERFFTETELTPQDFSIKVKEPEEMNYFEMSRFAETVKRNGGDPQKWLVEKHLKIALPFASFIIVLFGAPLSSPKRRGGMATGFGLSLVICFIYFGIMTTSKTFGHNGYMTPFISAWLANFVFLAGGFYALIKVPK